MSREDLHRSLERLRGAVEDLDSADEASKERVRRLMDSLERKLDEPGDEELHEHARHRLQEAVQHFERSHPRLIEVLDQIARTLSRGGI